MKDFEDLFATFIYNNGNKFLLDGNFPEDLETTEAVPVFKKKNCIDKSNYRPVSILLNTVKPVYTGHCLYSSMTVSEKSWSNNSRNSESICINLITFIKNKKHAHSIAYFWKT